MDTTATIATVLIKPAEKMNLVVLIILFIYTRFVLKKDILEILGIFIYWRLLLFLLSYIAVLALVNFNPSFPYYAEELVSTHLPDWIWGFGNFDGVHYLRIARDGYSSSYTQAFFPLFPLLIKLLTFNNHFFIIGFLISNIFFLGSLFIFYILTKAEYNKDIALKSVLLLSFFPTSYYFGAIYSESLFLFLVLLNFLFLKKQNYLLAGLIAGLASATRIIGITLFLVMLIDFIYSLNKNHFKISSIDLFKRLFGLFLAPMGLVFYMFYLKVYYNDFLYFLNAQPFFGASRSSHPFILLPQVLYRYFKILISANPYTYSYFTSVNELIFTLLGIFLLFITFRKINRLYWIFMLISFIVPTMTGTLSSMPRYSLMLFPALPFLVQKTDKYLKLIIVIFVIFQAILLSLFIRGYFVA